MCSARFDLLKPDFHVENEFCLLCSEGILKDSFLQCTFVPGGVN